jgi:energy-coupling factor transporter ATP-binding protein EcfA2
MQRAAGVDQLRLKFPGEKSLQFRDLSLSIFPGGKVLVLGPSGCGKSTLLQVLTGIIPHSLEVPVKYDEITIPDRYGYVFQDPDTQFCMPYADEEIAFVLENLGVARELMPAMIQEYLSMTGLVLADPHTLIQHMSQGMKQRLAIASALALEPDVLFLDEPTALLDPEGTDQVWETIKLACKEKTLVIVEHKIEKIIDLVDRIVVLDKEGQIRADGHATHVLEHCRELLDEYGIWYPGVWERYVQSDRYCGLREETAVPKEPVMEISGFAGYRGKEQKIMVDGQQVNAGEWIAVTGENGAGKTTLLLALMRLIRTMGTYRIRGTSAETEPSRLTGQIGFVFQNPELQFITNSVYDEIAYSLEIEGMEAVLIKQRVDELLAFFELADKGHLHPYQLSIGQKRRLSVAAAVIKQQNIVLLDEPTFGQDAANTFAMLEKLELWRQQGTTYLMVTHDMEAVRYFATRIWCIEQGRLTRDVLPDAYFGAAERGRAAHAYSFHIS